MTKKIKWSDLKPILETHSRAALLALVKELFDAMPDRDAFFTSRFFAESQDAQTILEPYRKRIVDQFFPARGFGKMNLREAKSAISDYRKATRDVFGTLELMLTYVEQGTRFTDTYGDIDEPFYNSMVSMLDSFAKLLTKNLQHYEHFHPRLLKLVRATSGMGWGYADDVESIVRELAEKINEDPTP